MNHTTTAPELVELTRQEQTIPGVAAAALGNLCAGIGVGVVVATLLHMAGSPGYWRWGGYSGLLAWGAIMALWFAQDEARGWWRWRELSADLAAAEDAIEWADDELAALHARLNIAEMETSRLRAENAAMQNRRNFVAAAPPPSDPAMQDAQELVRLFHANGSHPARAFMAQHYGWSERRYPRAFELLRLSGVVTVRGSTVRWTDDSEAAALSRLVTPDKRYLESSDIVTPVAARGEERNDVL